jgi:hypothetical protein
VQHRRFRPAEQVSDAAARVPPAAAGRRPLPPGVRGAATTSPPRRGASPVRPGSLSGPPRVLPGSGSGPARARREGRPRRAQRYGADNRRPRVPAPAGFDGEAAPGDPSRRPLRRLRRALRGARDPRSLRGIGPGVAPDTRSGPLGAACREKTSPDPLPSYMDDHCGRHRNPVLPDQGHDRGVTRASVRRLGRRPEGRNPPRHKEIFRPPVGFCAVLVIPCAVSAEMGRD